MWLPQDNVKQPLHVVTAIFNPVRYKSRWKLFRDFARHVREAGAILHTVEAAFGERQYAIAPHAQYQEPDSEFPSEPQGIELYKSQGPPHVPNRGQGTYTQIRVDHLQEIWLKENLLNIGVSRLPHDWKYVAFIDADVMFTRPDWVSETLHQLQHYHVVQMFHEAVDLDPEYGTGGLNSPNVKQLSHAYCHVHGLLNDHVTAHKHHNPYHEPHPHKHHGVSVDQGRIYRHPGFAWAWRRDAFSEVGGLMEHVLLGSADWHMAWALVGRVNETLKAPLHKNYNALCQLWQRRALGYINMNLGYVKGTLMHFWHGKKVDRGYATRWNIMSKHDYDPLVDIKKDWQGVIKLTNRKPLLRDDCRTYFRRRNEDSIDL